MVGDSKREAMLDHTLKLVAERGYHGASIKDVADAVGVRTAAVFYHFPTKADLMVAAVRRFADAIGAGCAALDGLPPAERLAAWVRGFGEDRMSQDIFCLCGILAAERNGLPTSLIGELKAFHDQVVGWLDEAVRALPTPPADPRAAAEGLFAQAEGALLLTRMAGDTSIYQRATGVMLERLGIAGVAVDAKP